MKTCDACKESKPLSAFSKKSSSSDGHNHKCRICQKAYWAEWYSRAENKERHVELTKKSGKQRVEKLKAKLDAVKSVPCSDCHKTYPPWVMDFDHVTEDKENDIANALHRGWSWKHLEKEIAKCEVVCSNCHRERTHKRRMGP